MTGAVKLALGSALLVSTYVVAGMVPSLRDEQSNIAHLQLGSRPPTYGLDTNTLVAEHEVEISNTSAMAQQNARDIRDLNANLVQLDKRELEHHNDLSRQQEVDETKVLQTLKVIGWLVSLAEGAHVTLIIKGLYTKRRRRHQHENVMG